MSETGTAEERFSRFVSDVEPRLRRALVAFYGVEVGCEVTADALEVAWQRWDSLEVMANPVGYLFRVAQSRSRRYRRRMPVLPSVPVAEFPDIDPRLPRALARLSNQQRAAVVLVHAHDWTLAETAEALGCGVSTVRNHLDRGMRRLRVSLGGDDA
ncbi:MAG TPA: sigma factor-like helix-turn-helix DNA-binding protein [Acidimicrobiia bacterium]|nr:sigma factor-like helix-turn-helix DNA-binding protein [Acidimicrobiia bacterium]